MNTKKLLYSGKEEILVRQRPGAPKVLVQPGEIVEIEESLADQLLGSLYRKIFKISADSLGADHVAPPKIEKEKAVVEKGKIKKA